MLADETARAPGAAVDAVGNPNRGFAAAGDELATGADEAPKRSEVVLEADAADELGAAKLDDEEPNKLGAAG